MKENTKCNKGKSVVITAAATIPNGYYAHMGHIDMQQNGNLTIAEGGL